MNHGLPILTDLKKERMTLRVLSGTIDSGQRIATGSVMIAGSGLLSVFDSELLFFAPGQGFYSTCVKDNQKTSFVPPEPERSFTLTVQPE